MKDQLALLMREAAILGSLLFLPNPGMANEFRLSSGVEITSGDYGRTANTNVVYSTFTARYASGPWSVWGTIPYVSVSGPGLVIDANVSPLDHAPPQFRERVEAFLARAEALGLPIAGDSSGLGDVTLGAARTIELSPKRLFAELSATLRLPTAETTRRLGTGAAEGAAQIDVIYSEGDFGVLVGGGRRFSERSEVFPLSDAWIATASVFRSVGPKAAIGLLYDWRQSEYAGAPPISELTAFVSSPVSDRWSVVTYAVTGFSTGSPDFGVGFRLSYDFEPRWFSRR